MTRHLATLRAHSGTGLSAGRRLYLKPGEPLKAPQTHCHLVVELHPVPRCWGEGLGCRLSIVASFHVLTTPRAINPVLHPSFQWAAVVEGFRNSPQFDNVAGSHRGLPTSSRLLRCSHDPL